MYCNNCGERGHVFKSCPEPIISCGILFLRGIYEPLQLPVDPKTLSVLMVRRKDSMSYMEFIRGKYDVEDVEYIKLQLSNMTSKERKMIETEDFEVLWSKLWGNCKDTVSPEFETARNKFQLLDLKTLLFDSPSAFSEPEWGFPKGRRMKGETDIDCALREFFEETNIPKEAFDIREDMSFTETFVGTNKVRYKHSYFVALLKDSKLVNLTQKLTNVQRREISNVAWKTMSECKTITRPHYVERQQMLTELERSVSLPQR